MKFSKTTFALAIFIIGSAAFMRAVLNFLYCNLGRSNLQILVVILFVAVGILIIYRKEKFAFDLKTLLIVALYIAGFIFASRMEIIEERVHLLEYGLLGWLATEDARKAFKSSSSPRRSEAKAGVLRFIGYPFLFVTAVGILDELFQWWLPTRVGDVRDVVFNTLGGAWGIALYVFSFSPCPMTPKRPSIGLLRSGRRSG